VNLAVKQNPQLTEIYFCGSIPVHIMSTTLYNLTDAAKEIGISRRALYKFYLKRYKPTYIGGNPILSYDQIKAIRAERRQRNRKTKAVTA
jgi:Bacterial regulatory protein, Fis family.